MSAEHEAVEITEVEFARAFVALYEAIDGVVDEMSERDFRLTQENWPLYLHAKEFLTSVTTPERPLPLHRAEAGYPNCSTCDGGGCPDCTDPA